VGDDGRVSRALDELLDILEPRRQPDGTFSGVGSKDDGWDNVYGGHLLGQATAAGLATVEGDRQLHSLHAYFLKSARAGSPITYAVEPVRDGRSFCTRRVTANQGGAELFELMLSCCVPEDGADLSPPPPPDFADLPEPESLLSYPDLMRTHDPLPFPADWALKDRAVDQRLVNSPFAPAGPSERSGIRYWMRADGALPDDPKVHAAILVYQSDDSVSDNVIVPFGVTWGTEGTLIVSLDHAMWFHRPFRADEWLFVEQWPDTAAGARGLATARFWDRSGRLVATCAQEALMRF
jgi:acyl-CoA thioesterase II